jgi:hypothetical protein
MYGVGYPREKFQQELDQALAHIKQAAPAG